MYLAYFSLLINELLKKDPDKVPEEYPLLILDNKYAVFIANNGNGNKHTWHICRRVSFVINSEK